jgi:CO/xanthine dehydrogenase FAD-binding subunit
VTNRSYLLPETLEEVTKLLDEYGPEILVMAGGTLAMPLINEGVSTPEIVLGLKRAKLNYLRKSNGIFVVGATTSLTQMTEQSDIPVLREAANAVGGWAIRNMGTIGGNLFAPPPGGDFAVALLALDAELKFVGKNGARVMRLDEFYTGFLTNRMVPGEILSEVILPIPKGSSAFIKYGRRHTNTPSIVAVAINIVFEGGIVEEARVALNAVGPHPFRAKRVEAYLQGKALKEEVALEAAELATTEIEPFTDPIASEWYRRKMVPVIVKRALERLIA